MKLSLSFLFFVAVFQYGPSNVISKIGTQEQLLSDANAVQNGSDVIITKPGPLEVVLNNANELAFEVCSMKCTADFLACYAPHSSNRNVLEDRCDTKCGFYVTTLGNKISFMKSISHGSQGVDKSDQCFQIIMKNGTTSVLDLNHEVATTKTCAPEVENGIVKLNINATSDCIVSIKNAIIKHETTTAPPATTLGELGRTSSGENGHVSATTAEPSTFFDDYWWIFLILGIILIAIGVGIGVGICCYLRRKKNAQKPIPARRRRLQGSKSPIVLQPSTETQNCKNESAQKG
uniref:Uncharacterized protein n=1 Tax=Panagrolaimus davidi TaxID=227884 RepID=A0A914Q256_9BILA